MGHTGYPSPTKELRGKCNLLYLWIASLNRLKI